MLIVPKVLAPSFLLGSTYTVGRLNSFLWDLHDHLQMGLSQQSRELIFQTCQAVFKLNFSKGEVRDVYLGQIAIAAIFIADQEIF